MILAMSTISYAVWIGSMALVASLMEVLRDCDRRMLRYMFRVIWRDNVESKEKMWIEQLVFKGNAKKTTLFDPVSRARDGSVLTITQNISVE